MTVREALNRGLNFVGVATLAVLATSVVHGIGLPYGIVHKSAEIALGRVGAAGIIGTSWGVIDIGDLQRRWSF